MGTRAQRGFSLIEAMTSTAIVGILASLALPAYQNYRFQSRATEAKTVIAGIRVSQEAFGAANDRYANIVIPNPDPTGPAGPPGSHRRLWDIIPCSALCSRAAPAACDRFACLHFQPSGTVHYQYASPSGVFGPAGIAEYAIGAQGDLDSDGFFGGFTYQSGNGGGPVGSLIDGISGCGLMPANERHDCAPTIY